MSKTELISEFRKNVEKLLEAGAKQTWLLLESELAHATFKQIIDWGDGPELLPMKASTLAKLQDFNKRYAMGGVVIPPEKPAKKVGRPKKQKATAEIEVDTFFDYQESDEVVPIKETPKEESVVNALDSPVFKPINSYQAAQIKDYKEDPEVSIDKAITLLNRACREMGVSCEIVIKSA